MPEEVVTTMPVISRTGGWARRIIETMFGPGVPMTPTLLVPPRRFDYNSYVNLDRQPRQGTAFSFQTLRSVADRCDLQRLVIETRKDQVEKCGWSITPTDDDADHEEPKYKARIDELTTFFKRPDRHSSWKQWIRMALEDILVIDALSVYVRRTLGGKVYSLELLDGATIRPMQDERGSTPIEGVAYQQVIKGEIAADFTVEDLYYVLRNPRTWTVYGFGPVEQMMATVAIAMNKQNSELAYYTEGNIPESLIGVPDDWPVTKTQEFQAYWDQMTADVKTKRRAIFIPGQIAKNYIPTRAVDLKDEHSEWLARVIAFGHSLPPTAFVKQMNRAQSEIMQDVALEEGLMPLLEFISDTLCNRVIQEAFGYTDLQWQWEDQKEPDILKEAQVNEIYVKLGVKSVDAVAQEIGEPPPGLGPAVFLPDGPMLIDDIIEKRELELETLRNPPEPPPMLVAPEKPGLKPGQPAPKQLAAPKPALGKMESVEGTEPEVRPVIGFLHGSLKKSQHVTVGLYKFDPAQPRHPAGTSEGGQWAAVEGAIPPIYASDVVPVPRGNDQTERARRAAIQTNDPTVGDNLPEEFKQKCRDKLKKLYGLTDAQLDANIEKAWKEAQHYPDARDHASWYIEAHAWAEDMRQGRYTIEQTAAALAAQSPSHDWGSNAMTSRFTAWLVADEAHTVVQLDRKVEAMVRTQLKATDLRVNGKALHHVLNGKLLADLTPMEVAAVAKAVAQSQGLSYLDELTGTRKKTSWSCGLRAVEASIEVLRGGSPDQALGGHKVRSFFNNILEGATDSSNVTIDTHAFSLAIGRRVTAQQIGAGGLFDSPEMRTHSVKGGYWMFADAYRRVATKHGLDPKELQAATWMYWRKYKVPEYDAQVRAAKTKKAIKMAIGLGTDATWSEIEADPWAHWEATGSLLGLSASDRALIAEAERLVAEEMAGEIVLYPERTHLLDDRTGQERVIVPFGDVFPKELAKYDPSQPREPKGSATGGRWANLHLGGPVDEAANLTRYETMAQEVEQSHTQLGSPPGRPREEAIAAAQEEIRAAPMLHVTTEEAALAILKDGELRSHRQLDAEVGQMIETMRAELVQHPNPELSRRLDQLVSRRRGLGTTMDADKAVGLDNYIFLSHGEPTSTVAFDWERGVKLVVDNRVIDDAGTFATMRDIAQIEYGNHETYKPDTLAAYRKEIVSGERYWQARGYTEAGATSHVKTDGPARPWYNMPSWEVKVKGTLPKSRILGAIYATGDGRGARRRQSLIDAGLSPDRVMPAMDDWETDAGRWQRDAR